MLRLGFTAADLGRTRVVPSAGPLAETVLSLGVVSGRLGSTLGDDWRAPVRRRVSPRDLELAAVLHPREHIILDLFTQTELPESMREAESELARADQANFARELAAAAPTTSPSWLTGLRSGDRQSMRGLARALAQAHARFVAPYWSAFGTLAESHRQRLVRSLGERGPADTLATVTGGSWDGPVLSIPKAGRWSETIQRGRLRGRGIVLAPTVLAPTPVPYFPLDRDRPAVLLCPVPRQGPLGTAVGRGRAGVDRLLGPTRTAVLRAIRDQDGGCSTSDAAALVGVSASTASEHLSVLRAAGLVRGVRHGHRMVHTVTPLGHRLLEPSDP